MGNYIYPFPLATVKNRVSQLFGQWPGGNNPWGGHTGIDFAVPEGTDVWAPCDGIIEFEGWVTGNYYDNPWWFLASDMVVVVNAGPGLPSFTMGHLSETLVNKGDRVRKGQVIAKSGNTGISTGPHCHFEYLPDNWDYQNGTYGRLDPQLVCDYWDGKSGSLQPQGDIVTAPVFDITTWAIDISNFQGDINIAAVNPDRVIIRTSEGVGGSDAWVEASVRKARNAGKAVDFYHFSHIGELDGNTAQAEAAYFLSQAKKHWRPGDHVVLDWEARYSQLWNGAAAKEWMDTVLASLGADDSAAVFYSNLGTLTVNHDGLKPYRDKYPNLWLAYYGSEELNQWGDPEVTYGMPDIPGGWHLWGWQYTQYGRVPGYNGNLDLSIIYGDTTMALTDDDIKRILNFTAFTPATGEDPVSVSLALKYATEVYRGLYKGGESTPDKDSLVAYLVKLNKAVTSIQQTVPTTALDNIQKQLTNLAARKQGATASEITDILVQLRVGGTTPAPAPALAEKYEVILQKVDKP